MTADASLMVAEEEFEIGNYSIVGSTTVGSDVELQVAADITNLSTGTFEVIEATLVGGLPADAQITASQLTFNDIQPNGTASALAPWYLTVVVPSATLSDTVAALEGETLEWSLDGSEVTLYNEGVYELDWDTFTLYSDHLTDADGSYVSFDAWSDLLLTLVSGDIIVFTYTSAVGDHYLDAPKTPWEVVEVVENGDYIRLYYDPRPDLILSDLIWSGTVGGGMGGGGDGMHQSVFDAGNTEQACEADPETLEWDCEYRGLYLTQVGEPLGDSVTADSAFNVRTVDVSFAARVREGEPVNLGIEFGLAHDTVFALQTTDAETTATWEVNPLLTPIHIPGVTFSIGGIPVEVGINFSIIVGAEASFSGPAALGWTQRGTINALFSVDLSDGTPSLTPSVVISPTLTSPPTLSTNATASVRTWGAVEAEVVVDGGVVAGPSLRVSAYSEFTVDPSADPWWALDAGGAVEGTLQLEVVGITVAAHTFGVSTESADTVTSSDLAYSDGTGLASGGQVRWAENYHYGGTYGDLATSVAALDDGGMAFVISDRPILARVDASGQLLWDAIADSSVLLGGVVPFEDGFLMVGKQDYSIWIGQVDGDGNQVRADSWSVGNYLDVAGVEIAEQGATPTFLIWGRVLCDDLVFRPYLAMVTYDPSASGDPLTFHWARTYDGLSGVAPYPDTFYTALYDDGDIYVGGTTTAGTSAHFYDAAVLRLDSAGDQVWAKAAIDGGDAIYALAMGADGAIAGAGIFGQNVTDLPYFHNCWFASFNAADGTLLQSTTLSEDLWWEAWPFTSDYPGYTTPGASIYDAPTGLVALEDGAFAAIGYSGLGYEVGWVMRLTPVLDVHWLSTLDGDGSNVPVDLVDVGDGLAVLTRTTSPALYGYGGSNYDALLLKVPYDGIVMLDPATGMSTRYTKPDMVPPPTGPDAQRQLLLPTDDNYFSPS